MAGVQWLVPWVAALVACVVAAPPRIAAPRTGGLVVDVEGAEPGWGLRLMRATGQGCAAAAAAAGGSSDALLQQRLIQAGQQRIHFPAAGLVPGNYCAVVVSPTGNLASLWPAEIKDPPGAREASCSNWSATVTLKGDYNLHTIEASVEPRDPPGCERVRVGLWLLTEQAALEGDCVHDITFVDELEPELPQEHSSPIEVRFESLAPGNYCVRVTPLCSSSSHSEDCLSLTSRVLELPPPPASQQQQGGGPKEEEEGGRLLLWLLLVPLLVLSALVMAVAVCWVRRRAWLLAAARTKKLAARPAQPAPTGPPPPPQPPAVVVRVVYSRDSEAHVGVVGALCALLQSELGVCVEYDEAATGPAHVTHDWALAMAHLPCPRFNSTTTTEGGGLVKMLVLESDGALLKHQAYRQHKDVGLASGSSVDELYHTTYAALLSRQAQALGDYCHLLVARLPCTSLPGRLDLVPEKRFLLPHHLPQLLQALLHDHHHHHPEEGAEQQQGALVAAALRSEARARLDRALAGCCSAHHGAEDEGLARLHLLLWGREGQEGEEERA